MPIQIEQNLILFRNIVQSPSIPALPTIPLSEGQYTEQMDYSSSSTYSQKMLHCMYYSSIPPLPVPKNYQKECSLKLRLHDAIYRLPFYSNSLIHILSLSNSHNNAASIQKNRGDKSHRIIVALSYNYMMRFIGYDSIETH